MEAGVAERLTVVAAETEVLLERGRTLVLRRTAGRQGTLVVSRAKPAKLAKQLRALADQLDERP